tara:strand:- start:226 stop:372 length:147 start_codon:yes stop_codon:yes gene_type:complete
MMICFVILFSPVLVYGKNNFEINQTVVIETTLPEDISEWAISWARALT